MNVVLNRAHRPRRLCGTGPDRFLHGRLAGVAAPRQVESTPEVVTPLADGGSLGGRSTVWRVIPCTSLAHGPFLNCPQGRNRLR